jgi:hypothetical protein
MKALNHEQFIHLNCEKLSYFFLYIPEYVNQF